MARVSLLKVVTDPPIEMVIRSTPSAMASSKAARILESSHPVGSHTLYTAILAEGTPPLATPPAKPKKLALATFKPAAVEDVWDPCPLRSLADVPMYVLAPITLLRKTMVFHQF